MSGLDLPSAFERRVAAALNIAVDVASRSENWSRPGKRLFVAGMDAVLGVLAVWIAFSLRLGEFQAADWPLLIFTGTMLACWYPIAIGRGIYSAIFRFAGRGAIVKLTVAVGLLTVPLLIAFMAIQQDGIPRTMAILGPLLFFLLMCCSRIIGRYVLVDLFNARAADSSVKRVVIYGAGATGQRLASALAVEAGMRVVGFIDDDPAKNGQFLDNARVYHSDQAAELVQAWRATDIVIAMSNIGFARRKAIIRSLEPLALNVQTLPPMRDLMEGRIDVGALRQIEVEDLLGRAVVPEKAELLEREVADKVVMVTGAGGSIGSEICRQILAKSPRALILVEANEFALFQIHGELFANSGDTALHPRLADVSNEAAVDRLFEAFSPQVVFHAAAYKHVPLVEENVIEAVRNNVFGTRFMALAAQSHGVGRFILISTDKAVRPPNVMGASKRLCEIILQDLAARAGDGGTVFAMVRFGNVLGSSGSVVPLFRRQIEEGGPLTVTHRDVTRYFMTIFEAAQLVIQAGAMARGGEVFLLDMGEPVKIMNLARSMVRLSGLTVNDAANPNGDIEIIETGLRVGEKLYEELLLDEDARATEHPRIRQGREQCPAQMETARTIARLERAVDDNNEAACRTALRALVPTLRSNDAASGEPRAAIGNMANANTSDRASSYAGPRRASPA